MAKLLLWDLDGTLADDRHRYHLYEQKRFSEYFAYDSIMADGVYMDALALYSEMKSHGWQMGYLTARLERNRQATVDWLTKHRFDNPETAILRPEEWVDFRPPRFKSEVIGRFIESGEYDEVVLVDNDLKVVQRIAEDHGEEHVFHADWDNYPQGTALSDAHLISAR